MCLPVCCYFSTPLDEPNYNTCTRKKDTNYNDFFLPMLQPSYMLIDSDDRLETFDVIARMSKIKWSVSLTLKVPVTTIDALQHFETG